MTPPELRFVVTGCSRSGTTYTAHLLTAAGTPCGHEDVFNRWTPRWGYRPPENPPAGLVGDSSFVAAPFTPGLADAGIVVVHQVRPPLDVVRSIVGLGHLDNDRVPYVQFIDHHAGIFDQPPGPRRAAAYWLAWNTLAETAADIRWDVTRLTVDDLAGLATRAGFGLDPRRAARALASTSTTTNHKARAEHVTLDDLGPLAAQVADTAGRYGIALETPRDAR